MTKSPILNGSVQTKSLVFRTLEYTQVAVMFSGKEQKDIPSVFYFVFLPNIRNALWKVPRGYIRLFYAKVLKRFFVVRDRFFDYKGPAWENN